MAEPVAATTIFVGTIIALFFASLLTDSVRTHGGLHHDARD